MHSPCGLAVLHLEFELKLLENGSIADQRTYEELADKNHRFRRMATE